MSTAIELYCPIPSQVNPLAAVTDKSIADWISVAGLHEGPDQLRRYTRSQYGTFGGRVCLDAGHDELLLFAKWLAFGFFYDDEFFDEGTSRESAGIAADAVVAIASVFASDGLVPDEARWIDTGRRHRLDVAADLLEQTRRTARPEQFSRFCAQMTQWFYSYLYEPVVQSSGLVSTLPAYTANRLYNIAAAPYVTLTEIVTGSPATADDLAAPGMRKLDGLAAYQMAWCNDVFSAAREAQVDDRVENLLTVLRNGTAMDGDQALTHAVRIHDETMRAFLRQEAEVHDHAGPGAIAHIDVLRTWMRGHYDWCRETARYQVAPPSVPSPVAGLAPAAVADIDRRMTA